MLPFAGKELVIWVDIGETETLDLRGEPPNRASFSNKRGALLARQLQGADVITITRPVNKDQWSNDGGKESEFALGRELLNRPPGTNERAPGIICARS